MQDDATQDSRLLIPALGNLYRRLSPYSYAFMRFSAGAVLVPHGVQKVLYTPVVQFSGNIAGARLSRPTAAGLPDLLHGTGRGGLSRARSVHADRRAHDLDRDGGYHYVL